MTRESLKVENGKYEIVLEKDYSVNIYRGEKDPWIANPPGSKMFIALVYETQEKDSQIKEMREILNELVDLKDLKDREGKNPFYQKHQPLAWSKAREFLKEELI